MRPPAADVAKVAHDERVRNKIEEALVDYDLMRAKQREADAERTGEGTPIADTGGAAGVDGAGVEG